MLYLSCRVPAASDGLRLDAFLRRQGLSAGLIRAVKHTAGGFFAAAQRAAEKGAGFRESPQNR